MGSRPRNALTAGLPECPERKDPLTSFLWFIQERESVRLKKESGAPKPWTTDPILDQYKFTNINRANDRLSRFNQDMLEPIKDDLLTLWFNCLILTHIYRQDTAMHIGITHIDSEPLNNVSNMQALKVKYGTAYQCPAQYKTILGYPNREEMLFNHLPKVAKDTLHMLTPNKSLKEIVDEINVKFGFNNNFINTQALLQLSEVRPDVVDGLSEIFIGPGATPALQLLYPDLTPSCGIFKLLEEPLVKKICKGFSDTEHGLCEWRKFLELKYGIRKPKKNLTYKGAI